MVRCKAITNNNRRCKKKACYSEFCSVHVSLECGICEKECVLKDRHTLKSCGHSFCTKCLTNDFYTNQWFDGFSTENVIKCPECELEVCDDDWSFITDYLCVVPWVKSGLLQRKIIYDTYLSPDFYKELHPFIKLGKENSQSEMEKISLALNGDVPYWKRNKLDYNSSEPSIVYFFKFTKFDEGSYYRFLYGCPAIKNLFEHLQKELVEYVFHPSRIKCIERLDEI